MRTTTALTALLLCACSGPTVTTSPPPSTSPPIDDALCATLDAEQRAAIDAWNAANDANPLTDDMLPEALLSCVRAQDGVWGVVLTEPENWSEDDHVSWSGRGTLVHVDRAGQRVAWGEHLDIISDCYDHEVTLSVERVSGVDRAVLGFITSCPDGEGWSQGHLLVAEGGALVPADGAPESAERAVDRDDDGLHDLIISKPYSRALYVCGGLDGTVTPERSLLMHAQPDGTFSMDDDLAREHLQAQCPEPPADLLPEEENGWRVYAVAEAMLCARFYGTSVETMKAALDEACVDVDLECPCGDPYDDDCDCEEPECIDDVCANADRLLELVAPEPPVTLTP